MESQSAKNDSRIAPEPAAYTLPFENALLGSMLELADKEREQAEAAIAICRLALKAESEGRETLYHNPQIKPALAAGAAHTAKSLQLMAESALEKQTAVSEILAAAATAARQQTEILGNRIREVKQEIYALERQTLQLRADFALATDHARITEESYTTQEAKRLLDCLEKAYQRHELLQSLHRNQAEAGTNLEYIIAAEQQARQRAQEAASLLKQAQSIGQHTQILFPPAREAAAPPVREREAASIAVIGEVKPRARASAWGVIWSYSKLILVAILLAFVLRAYVFDITDVYGVSMYPTLHDGDYLITSKVSYILSQPERGDIIVFNAPDSPGEKYIKRIIGLPNESILIEDGQVYIDDRPLDEQYLNGLDTNGYVYTIIPEGFYFVMGDNRGESRDSRNDQVGMISSDSLHGKAVLRLYPFSAFGAIE